ncbi:MAG: ChbG/HpnK family deacetylase [Anaerolineales bacterium]|nr:ChbG/HpnK family deacetylase [Chloroflexota bacterium]MBL6980429.1 ChbG/HpnK family deacetylase [Anaerolineales bacterium]
MKLILNADDLGFSPLVNQTIFKLHKLGRLTSASLVVNMPASQLALEEINDHPNLSVGIHLNLTKGIPITPVECIPSLVRLTGSFYHAAFFYPLAVAGAIAPTEVQAECRSQIELALKAGLEPTHLDSHNHWHMLPRFKKIILKLAQEYEIPSTRPTNPRHSLLPSRIWLQAVVDRNFPLRFPDSVHYVLALDDWMNLFGKPRALFFGKILNRILNKPNVTLELVLHPGRAPDPDFPRDSISPKRRQWDCDFVCSAEFEAWLESINGKISQGR